MAHVPGEPNVVAANMPGGASRTAVQWLEHFQEKWTPVFRPKMRPTLKK
jgi:hypothetical protein